MSFRHSSQAWDIKTNNPLRKTVLLRLADHADPITGESWPSIEALAEFCEMSPRSVRGHIRDLEKLGLVKTETRFRNGKQKSNVYILNLGKGELLDTAKKLRLADENLHNYHQNYQEQPDDLGRQELQLGRQEIPLGRQELPTRAAGAADRSYQLDPISDPIKDLKGKLGEELTILESINQKRLAVYKSANLKCRELRPVDGNLKPIKSVMKSGYSISDINLVVDHLMATWGSDREFRTYLTPETMFRVTKFEAKLSRAHDWDVNGRPLLTKQPETPPASPNFKDTSWADEFLGKTPEQIIQMSGPNAQPRIGGKS